MLADRARSGVDLFEHLADVGPQQLEGRQREHRRVERLIAFSIENPDAMRHDATFVAACFFVLGAELREILFVDRVEL